MPTDIEAIEALARRHEDRLTAAMTALQQRSHWSGFQESPSRKHHPEGAAEAGRARFESLLDTTVALGQTHREHILAPEVSPYTGRALGIHYERTTVDDALDQANDAQAAWQQLSPRHRVALCMEWLDRLAAESFLYAHATMHTTGQAFMMAYAGSGANALDRGLEALAMAALVMQTLPAQSTFTRPFGRGAPVTLDKRFHIVGVGPAAVFTCASYPAWNAYPAICANLAVGNPVLLKPHPTSVLPMALAVQTGRELLASLQLPPDALQLVLDPPDALIGEALIDHPSVQIVDFTGSQRFGAVIERRHPHAYTETSGCASFITKLCTNDTNPTTCTSQKVWVELKCLSFFV